YTTGLSFTYKGIVGDINARNIHMNKIPTDPLSNTNYIYGVNSSLSQYQIATTLENIIAYDTSLLIPTVYADTSYQAKVSGDYPGYFKFSSGSEVWIANIPSLLWNNTGSVNLLSSGTYFVVNKQTNLPYKLDESNVIQNKDANQIIQAITSNSTTTLTGVNITGVTTSTGVSEIFTGNLLVSFGGDITKMQAIVLGNITTAPIPEIPSVNIPSAPIASAASSITQTSITWNWQASANATSYQFSTDNSTWTDKGNTISFNETGLTCATSYTRYIKACSAGGCSNATTLSSTSTSECPFLATGGTITYSGGYTIHTFTSDGTFTPNTTGTVEYLVVGGGGGGGMAGGGGGGFREGTNYSIITGSHSITVGSGGTNGSPAQKGGDSIFGSIVATGGGGASGGSATRTSGGSGGSGGGCAYAACGGGGNTPATIPSQGNDGGGGNDPGGDSWNSGGGGGAGGVGTTAISAGIGGAGGVGKSSSISGILKWYAGGGGGNGATTGGVGGNGGGGNAGSNRNVPATAGTPNTGGGGGGDNYNNLGLGADGGSGIVIIRYLSN
ncbi:hypothetical protein COW06_02395, partial [Candidatus Gracilibacteria bacterium CG12_big_fil_rev_8_21_14_0_65_38_15]